MDVRRILLSSLSVLALAACAPSDEDKEGREGTSPFGYELAKGPAAQASEHSAAVIDLSVQQLREKLDAGNVRLIDVRTAEEVALGVIPGAEHIALDQFDPATLDAGDGREVILYCRSGRRSRIAGEQLSAHTGMPAQHLGDGILSWQAAGEPVAAP